MMLNPKNPTSKKQQNIPKSPKIPLNLKNPNITSSFSSSCSNSSDVPSGCLRFLSNVSKNGNKTPKLTPKGSNFRVNGVKKGNNLSNPDDFTAKVRKPSRRYDLFDEISKKSSGFGVKFSDNGKNLRKNSSKYDLSDEIGKNLRKPSMKRDFSGVISKNSSGVGVKFSDNGQNLSKKSSRYDISNGNFCDSTEDFTPVNKCDGVSRSPTPPPPPPLQSSVSPEIQCGLASVVAATPSTCYAAGHVMSGVTDKRKCRPKGILTIGYNDLFGSSRTTGFRSDRRDSIVPCPIEASVCWLSSSCDDVEGSRCEKLLPFNLVGCSSSPLSSFGFSSEMFSKSNCTIASDVSTASCSSRSKSFMLHSDMSSEFRGVLGPSLDHLVRGSSPLSPVAMPVFKVEFSPGHGKFRHEHEMQCCPDLEDSLGSGNVMQTPESNSSPVLSRNFDLSDLGRDQISRSWSECELDSVTDALCRVNISPDFQMPQLDSPRPSFEFNPLGKLDSSSNLTLARKAISTSSPDISESLPDNSPEPEVRIAWREMDELDCCRYLSDEDNTTDHP